MGQFTCFTYFQLKGNLVMMCAISGETKEKPLEKPSPAASHEHVTATSPQTSMRMSTTDVLSTSGTFEKVPSPAPESFEQLSMPQMPESRVTAQASASEKPVAAAVSPLMTVTPADSPVQAGMILMPPANVVS